MHLVSHQAYILERAYNVPNKKILPLTKFFHIGVLGNAFLSITHGAALKCGPVSYLEYGCCIACMLMGCCLDVT